MAELMLGDVLARGWTRAMVHNLLAKPDRTKRGWNNTILLFDADRVIAIEQSDQFAQAVASRESAGRVIPNYVTCWPQLLRSIARPRPRDTARESFPGWHVCAGD